MSRLLFSLTFVMATAFMVLQAPAQSFRDASSSLPPSAGDTPLGASLVDINNDGFVDIYRRGNLYLQSDGEFQNMLETLGLDEADGVVFGAVMGDYNEDGFADLFFMDLLQPSKLYRNQAGMGYVQSNAATGIQDQDLVQGSLWTDVDQDGLLDLFVGIDGGTSNLFMNQSNHLFTNVSDQAGLVYQATYGLAAADYDRDGDPDIFLTQCFAPIGSTIAENVLLELNDGVYTNVSESVGIVDDLSSWGTVWLDYNNDGWLDIYTVNLDHRSTGGSAGVNTLYRNNEGLGFTDVSVEAGVAGREEDSNIGVSAADFDNDGWIDIVVVNRSGGPANLYRNLGDGTFEDIVPTLSVAPVNSQAVAVADINNDGWIDLFIPAQLSDQLLINEGGTHHYLKVRTRGTDANYFGIGARLDLYANGGQQVREITAGDGMTSQNHDLSAHFGLGDQSTIDSLTISWPGGNVSRLGPLPADQEITVVEGVGLNLPPEGLTLLEPIDQASINNDLPVSFTWAAADDPEQDALAYTLHISGPALDTTFAPTSLLSIDVDNALFAQDAAYRWTVTVSDGYSVRSTMYQTFNSGFPTHAESSPSEVPQEILLEAYPNPFTQAVTLPYSVPATKHINIAIYDVLGQKVVDLADHTHAPNTYTLVWDGENNDGSKVAPGVYFARVTTQSQQTTHLIIKR